MTCTNLVGNYVPPSNSSTWPAWETIRQVENHVGESFTKEHEQVIHENTLFRYVNMIYLQRFMIKITYGWVIHHSPKFIPHYFPFWWHSPKLKMAFGGHRIAIFGLLLVSLVSVWDLPSGFFNTVMDYGPFRWWKWWGLPFKHGDLP